MGIQRQATWRGGVCTQVLLCLVLLATLPWIAVSNDEVDALHALRQALADPYEVLMSWDPSLANPCEWLHITCNTNNSVVRVDLGNAFLSGNLVPQLGLLSNLLYLEMYSNNISGVIPASLGNLTHLKSLDLYANALTGAIPESLGNLSSLSRLRLANNTLSGSIPASLTSLNNLQTLDLSFNQLSGSIPVNGSFANFTASSFRGNPGLYYPAAPAGAPTPDA